MVEPQLGQNIGTGARAMANFGLEELRIVNPRDGWPNEHALKASANASSIIDKAVIYPTLQEAIADVHTVFATTARPRDMVKEICDCERAGQRMVTLAQEGARSAILFGREKSGLTNEHLSLADCLVIAPVNPECASLNLAQAVLLMSYEWQRASGEKDGALSLGRRTSFKGPAAAGMPDNPYPPATKGELVHLFDHLEKELDAGRFFHPPDKAPKMMQNVRNMFHRMNMTHQDVQTFRGMIRALTSKK